MNARWLPLRRMSRFRPFYTFLLLGFLLVALVGRAQTYYSVCHVADTAPVSADSLKTAAARTEPGQQRVRVLLRLGAYYVYKIGEFKTDLDSGQVYAQQARQLSQKIGYPIGEILSLNLLGTISREARQYPQSAAYQQQAIALSKSRRDVLRMADSYRLLSETWRAKADQQTARQAARTALALYTQNGYQEQAAEAHLELGNSYANWGAELDQKIKYFQQGLQGFVQLNNIRRQADVHKDLGDLYQLQGANAQAMIELRKALALYRAIRFPHVQGVYDLLGNSSMKLGYNEEGLKYGLLAVKTAETNGDNTLQLCTIYNRVGVTYSRLNQNQKALFYFRKSLAVAQKYNDAASIVTLSVNIASISIRLGQPGKAAAMLLHVMEKYPEQDISIRIYIVNNLLKAYTAMKQYAQAQRYCDQLLDLSGKLNKADGGQVFVYSAILPFYLKTNQYRQARKYLLAYEWYSKNGQFEQGANEVQWFWFKLDSAQGNYLSAIRHYQQYKALGDSVFNETKSRQLANLEVLYETEKKEQDIKLKEQSIKALTRTQLLQEERIKREQLIRNVIVGGVILLLLLLTLIYNRYRLKQRSNRLLEAKQQEINQQNEQLQQVLMEKNTLLAEKESLLTHKDNILLEKDGLLQEKQWLLREVHHRVKNNLQVVVSLLSSQAAYLLDEKALLAIQESQNRIHAISLIHQKLYLSENIALIGMNAYIREVAAYLLDSFQMDDRVQLQIAVDPIELDGAIAVPMGLIINEAVTNSLKYAFPGGRNGQISISLQAVDGQTCLLTIADDGIGLDQAVDLAHTRSLGMVLMKGLTKQLDGSLNIENTDGLTIKVLFNKTSKKVSLEKAKVL